MKNKLVATFVAFMTTAAIYANDGVYYVNGSHLEPLQETDIAVKSEVLTISICDDGYAYVEVDYKFMNEGKAKNVTMGFEAHAPFNDDGVFNPLGVHPHIKDFSVVMNGETLKCRNGLIFAESDEGKMPEEAKKAKQKGQKYISVDVNRWQLDDGMGEQLYNPQTNEYADYAYAYYFDAKFNKGINTVRHTYAYRMSNEYGLTFHIPYWLRPAMRWANHQIDDFTLRIKADKCTKHFIISNLPFGNKPFRVTEGKGKTRILKNNNPECTYTTTEVVLRNGTVEWHSKNFRPEYDMSIDSADDLDFLNLGDEPTPIYYDSGITYSGPVVYEGDYSRFFPNEGTIEQTAEFAGLVISRLPLAHRGYVFNDEKLNQYFNSQWWYMPDPTWRPTAKSFNKHELGIITDFFIEEE